METRRVYHKRLPSRISEAPPSSTIVVFDKYLVRAVPGFSAWLRRFPFRFGVASGESLKSIGKFEELISEIHARVGEQASPQWTLLAIGGGSVGDFAGFVASVYKRGLKLVHMPTTWLSAIDSSHGGKTGLNFGGSKNQIGTFYPAHTAVLVEQMLAAQPSEQILDAGGELLKIALVDGRPWAKKELFRAGTAEKKSKLMWKLLPSAIDSKMRIVRRDPFEKTGVRQLLNLGHTFGHVIEAALGLSHGRSVLLGLDFAISFSKHKRILNGSRAERIEQWWADNAPAAIERSQFRPIAMKEARSLLLQDKKREGRGLVRFIFVKDFGKCTRLPVSADEILEYARKTGWIR